MLQPALSSNLLPPGNSWCMYLTQKEHLLVCRFKLWHKTTSPDVESSNWLMYPHSKCPIRKDKASDWWISCIAIEHACSIDHVMTFLYKLMGVKFLHPMILQHLAMKTAEVLIILVALAAFTDVGETRIVQGKKRDENPGMFATGLFPRASVV